MATIERGGARVRYDLLGEGPPLLLTHGLLTDGRLWAPLLPALASRYRVINVDLRGHRGSTAPSPFSLEDLADDCLAILDAEGFERAAIAGLSMGGMTAMRLALRAPERVAALLLLSTSADAERPRERLKYRAMAEIFRVVGSTSLFELPIRRLMFGRTALRERPEIAALQAQQTREHERTGLYHAVRAVMERGSIRDRLRELRCPSLVLVGDEDLTTPISRATRIGRSLPGARVHLLPRTGHLCTLEAPELVAEELLAFLAEVGW